MAYQPRMGCIGRVARMVAGVGMLLAFTGAAPAMAASAVGGEAVSDRTSVSVDEGTLRIAAAGDASNALYVRGGPVGYDIYDDYSDLVPGGNCSAIDPHHVTCSTLIGKVSIDAGAGDDHVVIVSVSVPVAADGGPGDDFVEGGDSKLPDVLTGGAGDDAVVGNDGNDVMTGDAGDDMLRGGTGGDRLSGGAGADVLEGGPDSSDFLFGGEGADLLKGGAGDDTLQGGSGDDVLVTGDGTDNAFTGTGADIVFGTQKDHVTCAASTDQVATGADGVAPEGCGPLPGGAKPPSVWPPPATSDIALRAGSSQLPRTVKLTKILFKVPTVEKISVSIASGGITSACVKVTLRTAKRRLKSYLKRVNTKVKDVFTNLRRGPIVGADINRARGKRCR